MEQRVKLIYLITWNRYDKSNIWECIVHNWTQTSAQKEYELHPTPALDCTHGTVQYPHSHWGLVTPVDSLGEVNIISIQAGGNSLHKYSIMSANAQPINIPTAVSSQGATEKQRYYEKLSWPSQGLFGSLVSTWMIFSPF